MPRSAASLTTPEEIHRFWFADSLTDPAQANLRMPFWFNSTRENDQDIAQRFGLTLRDASLGALGGWEDAPRSRLALIVVLDQFPRNIHRGTAAAFRHDAQALDAARRGVSAGHLRSLQIVEQAFFLMPFQHAEDRASQREGTVLLEQMVSAAPAEWCALAGGFLNSAREHAEIIERFGRFPHRNGILGRASTQAERDYLASNSESFGQKAS
jgi:uncharacterized protein (DUF924 family)